MINIVSGKIGSGKTYYAVYYLVTKYYSFIPEIFQYSPKKDIQIITNIKDLEMPHIDLENAVFEKGLKEVFSEEYVKSFGKQNVVYIIDEAQGPSYFHRKYYDTQVFLFFQKCRHIGVDIILITQDTYNLCPTIRTLAEYEVQAIQRTARLKNLFMYKFVMGDEVFKRSQLKFDRKIANLYTSFQLEEKEKVHQPWKRYAAMTALMLLIIVAGIKIFLGMYSGEKSLTGKRQGGGALTPTSADVKPVTSSVPLFKSPQEAMEAYKKSGDKVELNDGRKITGLSGVEKAVIVDEKRQIPEKQVKLQEEMQGDLPGSEKMEVVDLDRKAEIESEYGPVKTSVIRIHHREKKNHDNVVYVKGKGGQGIDVVD